MCISISIFIIAVVVVFLLIVNSNKNNVLEETDTLYSLSELKFLNEINTNEIFTTLDSDVNSELIGTYAILTTHNYFEDTYNIIALKKDNTTVKIATTEYSPSSSKILNLFYSNGKIYYDGDHEIWSIDINEGNGNYNLKEMIDVYIKGKFLENYNQRIIN